MYFQKIRFETGAEKICNLFLVRPLLVLGGVNLKDLYSHFI